MADDPRWNPERLVVGDFVVWPTSDRDPNLYGEIIEIASGATTWPVARVRWPDGVFSCRLDMNPTIRRMDIVTRIGKLD